MTEQQETSTQTTMTPEDKNAKTLSDWIGDMVALESHIEEALDRQLKQVKDDPIALEAVQGFHDLVKGQRDAVKALQEQYGSTAGSPIKQIGSALLGKAAGIIDMVRTEGNSKSIRDDYTAFNLAAIGYTMLHTTAKALGDQRVASLAEQHLRGYAGAIQKINHMISDVVVSELAKDGHKVQEGAAAQTYKIVDAAWKATDQSGSRSQSMAG
jgi:ferritin-like metal-binding protein YciE